MEKIFTTCFFVCFLVTANAQTLKYGGREFTLENVKASVEKMNGENVVRIERDLAKLPFDVNRLGTTVDEPTFIRIKDLDMKDGTIEVKMLSCIQNPSPFDAAQGFIGLAYHINKNNTAFESIYFRPKVGRSDNQFARNHTVQYYAYPDYKFDKLRLPEYQGQYETYADIGLNEWITVRFEVKDKTTRLYINNQKYPSFVVAEMKGSSPSGSVGLWVDIGTVGYFKDLKIKNM